MNRLVCYISLLTTLSNTFALQQYPYDLSVVGEIWFAESIARLPILLIDMLKDDVKLNFIPSSNAVTFQDVPQRVQEVVNNPDKAPGAVSLLLTLPANNKGAAYHHVPKESHIRIAYIMFEADPIPPQWIPILNNDFDVVVVTDTFCKDLFIKSGIKTPVFTLPHGAYLEDFLKKEVRKTPGDIFRFGVSAGFNYRKNLALILEAFAQEFGNNPKVQLILHGRAGGSCKNLHERVKQLNLTNVEIINETYTHKQYVDFITSLDCYVLLSRGEGFSVSPREALAAGIPCILSNNSAHTTICKTGFVRAVNTESTVTVLYPDFNNYPATMWNADFDDSCKALKEVYEYYPSYKYKALKGRQWVKHYLIENLKPYYLSLIKPTKVVLGQHNHITKEHLMTNSPELYKKYNQLIELQK
ncbi:glycosyltransferase [Candidatus Dependentiae bacterium]|nr:glycosyltransferase [Candidatus Dependentiae bacterium]